MALMLFQRVATAVREGYGQRDDVESQLESARACRLWAEGLAVDPTTRAALVEPIAAVEDGLREILRRRAGGSAAG
jgi:hypothetical protein